MSVLIIVYTLFIGPLELFFEVVFSFANRLLGDPGLAIIFLSLAMNFLVLPLYRRADAMQEAERDRAAAMKPAVDHIKKTFKGDERFMVLQTYYRQCGFKQTDSLKGSVSLLLEIPFFIAAYHFLSNLHLLNGVPFGPIPDLGSPDGLLVIGGMTINVLPLLMTAINLVSAAIYMKGFPLKSKIQMYGIAAIFLVLLYSSPAGLVFYWTLNNLFSLVKNVFYKFKNPGFVLSVLLSVAGIVGLVALFVTGSPDSMRMRVFLIIACLALQIPLVVSLVRRRTGRKLKLHIEGATTEDKRAFFYCCLFVALLTGLLIPSAVIGDSPLEFIDVRNYSSPLWYIVSATSISIGTFVIWFGVFYWLATPVGKKVLGLVMWVFAGAAAVDYMFFGTNYGNLSPKLQFDFAPDPGVSEMLINVAVLLALAALFALIWKKKGAIMRFVAASMCIAVVVMSVANVMTIRTALATVDVESEATKTEASIPLSTEGQNVVVLMLDRAASCYLPTILEEKPELREKFDGFTYYPNTISYASATNYGIPGLFGGYEYIPRAMNERGDESLMDKHDEALKVMPALFYDQGYEVTVCDPSYAGYREVPDLSIYDAYPGMNAYVTMNGEYPVEGFGLSTDSDQVRASLMRNFFCFGLFKAVPEPLQSALYANGTYNAADVPSTTQVREGISKSTGIDGDFMRAFGVLDSLPEMTEIVHSDKGTFLAMCNETTHKPTLLAEGEYMPSSSINNTAYDEAHPGRYEGKSGEPANDNQVIHYHVNVASLLKVGEWFDYLREQGVYDNTRIIIVSDHAWPLDQSKDTIFSEKNPETGEMEKLDTRTFNCMLLEKDFNAKGFSVDEKLMTNADTPLLATAGIIDNPTNPFTGKKLDDSVKHEPEQDVVYVETWQIDQNNGNTFLPGHWFSLRGDEVAKGDNWSYLGYY